jgi:hypothetical protein
MSGASAGAGADELLDIVVVRGGSPDPAQTAAIVQAIRSMRSARSKPAAPPRSLWSLAGRLEAAGRPTITSRVGLPSR